MIDKIFLIFMIIIIAISFVSINARLEIIQSKLEMDTLNVKIIERVQVLKELNFSYEEIQKNVNKKYCVASDELEVFLKEGAE